MDALPDISAVFAKHAAERRKREAAEALGTHHHGSFGQYMHHKKAKLDLQYKQRGTLSSIFEGAYVYVDGFTDSLSRDDIKDIIITHGGHYNQFPGPGATHVIANNIPDGMARREWNKKRRKPLLYVRPEWIVDSVEAGIKLPVTKYVLQQMQNPEQLKLSGFIKEPVTETVPGDTTPSGTFSESDEVRSPEAKKLVKSVQRALASSSQNDHGYVDVRESSRVEPKRPMGVGERARLGNRERSNTVSAAESKRPMDVGERASLCEREHSNTSSTVESKHSSVTSVHKWEHSTVTNEVSDIQKSQSATNLNPGLSRNFGKQKKSAYPLPFGNQIGKYIMLQVRLSNKSSISNHFDDASVVVLDGVVVSVTPRAIALGVSVGTHVDKLDSWCDRIEIVTVTSQEIQNVSEWIQHELLECTGVSTVERFDWQTFVVCMKHSVNKSNNVVLSEFLRKCNNSPHTILCCASVFESHEACVMSYAYHIGTQGRSQIQEISMLPVEWLPGVPQATQQQIRHLGMSTFGDMVSSDTFKAIVRERNDPELTSALMKANHLCSGESGNTSEMSQLSSQLLDSSSGDTIHVRAGKLFGFKVVRDTDVNHHILKCAQKLAHDAKCKCNGTPQQYTWSINVTSRLLQFSERQQVEHVNPSRQNEVGSSSSEIVSHNRGTEAAGIISKKSHKTLRSSKGLLFSRLSDVALDDDDDDLWEELVYDACVSIAAGLRIQSPKEITGLLFHLTGRVRMSDKHFTDDLGGQQTSQNAISLLSSQESNESVTLVTLSQRSTGSMAFPPRHMNVDQEAWMNLPRDIQDELRAEAASKTPSKVTSPSNELPNIPESFSQIASEVMDALPATEIKQIRKEYEVKRETAQWLRVVTDHKVFRFRKDKLSIAATRLDWIEKLTRVREHARIATERDQNQRDRSIRKIPQKSQPKLESFGGFQYLSFVRELRQVLEESQIGDENSEILLKHMSELAPLDLCFVANELLEYVGTYAKQHHITPTYPKTSSKAVLVIDAETEVESDSSEVQVERVVCRNTPPKANANMVDLTCATHKTDAAQDIDDVCVIKEPTLMLESGLEMRESMEQWVIWFQQVECCPLNELNNSAIQAYVKSLVQNGCLVHAQKAVKCFAVVVDHTVPKQQSCWCNSSTSLLQHWKLLVENVKTNCSRELLKRGVPQFR